MTALRNLALLLPLLLTTDVAAEPLADAAWDGSVQKVKALIRHRASVDKVDSDGDTPLTSAAYQGHGEVAALLLKEGASVDKVDGEGNTPLTDAAARGHGEVAALLLKEGASVDKVDGKGYTPLTMAAYYGHGEVAALLQKKGAAFDRQDGMGRTPLMGFARSGNMQEVKRLVGKGAKVLLRDAAMHTAQSQAALQNHAEVAEYLAKKSPQGLEFLKYHVTRWQAWLSVTAGLAGGIFVHFVTDSMARRPMGQDYSPVPGGFLLTAVAEPPTERPPPRGAMLLAAKKVRGGLGAKWGRTVQILANVVAPFGLCMLFFQPLLVMAAFVVCYALPAWCRHGARTVVEKPILLVSAANPALGLLRGLVCSLVWAALLHDLARYGYLPECWVLTSHFPAKNSDWLPWYNTSLVNPAKMLLNPLFWGPDMYDCICYYLVAVGLVIFVFVLGSLFLCCRGQEKGRMEQEEDEVQRLAKEVVQATGDETAQDAEEAWQKLEEQGVTRLRERSRLSDVDFLLAFTAVDCLLDVNTIILLLLTENYKFAAFLMMVVNASLLRTISKSGLRQIWEGRNQSLKKGYLTHALCELIDVERGFEAFFSLALTSYSLLFSVTTRLQLLIQLLSMLASVWVLAGALHEYEDLGVL